MQHSIEQFKSVLKGGGMRPNQFEVDVVPCRQMRNFWTTRELKFLCKASSVPAHTITPVSIGIPAGGALKVPGSKVFEPWSITVISDDAQRLRRNFEIWSEIIIGGADQLTDGDNSQYLGTAIVTQLGRDSRPIQYHRLEYLYPTNISACELSYENQGIQEFSVTFAYHFHVAFDAVTNPLYFQPFF